MHSGSAIISTDYSWAAYEPRQGRLRFDFDFGRVSSPHRLLAHGDGVVASNGWVKNWRKLKEWQWYAVPNMAHLFQHLIREANHETQYWRDVRIERGQILTGLDSLQRQTGITVRSLRTCLKRLKSTGEIARQTTNRFSLITINNYEVYQGSDVDSDRQNDKQADKRVTSKRQASDRPADSKQEVKNEKNDKKIDITSRQESFKLELQKHASEFGIQTVNAFYDYWSESNQQQTKMRYEMQKTWDTKKRLATWKRNESNFGPKHKPEQTFSLIPRKGPNPLDAIRTRREAHDQEFERKRIEAQKALTNAKPEKNLGEAQ